MGSTTTVPGRRMRAEIAEQPAVLARLAETLAARDPARLVRGADVLLVGRGTSRIASGFGALALSSLRGLRAGAASPTFLGRYRPALDLGATTVVCVSQSGRSREVVEAAEWSVCRGARVVAVTNDPSAPLAAVAGVEVLELGAGAEEAVPATKTMTATLAWLLALAAGRDAVVSAAAAVQAALEIDLDDAVAAARAARSYVVVGEGPALPAAEEGALKLRETNAALTLAAETSDVLHGSIAAAREDTLLLGTWCDPVGEALWRAARDAWAAAGGPVQDVAPAPAPGAGRSVAAPRPAGADPRVLRFARAVGLVVLLQRLALETAVARGLDPDRPAHTSKITDVGTA